MKRIILSFICLISVIWANSQSIGPEVIASSGNYYVGTNATLSWTLGEVVIETFSGTNNILTQGFQQPEFGITGIEEEPNNNFNVNIYPNPAVDYINIEVVSNPPVKMESYKIKILDMSGKVLYQQLLLKSSRINLNNFAASTYILRVETKDGELINTYKVQKLR